jgi:hypothetical protein
LIIPDGSKALHKGFRRLKGHADMPKLVAALRTRDQQLGITVSAGNVA